MLYGMSVQYFHTFLWGAAAGLAVYRYRAKVRYPLGVVGGSACMGYGAGIFHYFRRHAEFARQLDDRLAFLLVLENVNKRTGNRAQLFQKLDLDKLIEDVKKRRAEHGETFSPDTELVTDSLDPLTEGVTSSTPPARAHGESVFPSPPCA